jgi:hypothetical protein
LDRTGTEQSIEQIRAFYELLAAVLDRGGQLRATDVALQSITKLAIRINMLDLLPAVQRNLNNLTDAKWVFHLSRYMVLFYKRIHAHTHNSLFYVVHCLHVMEQSIPTFSHCRASIRSRFDRRRLTSSIPIERWHENLFSPAFL